MPSRTCSLGVNVSRCHLALVVKVLALDDAVGGQLVDVGPAVVAPRTNTLGGDELSAKPALPATALNCQKAETGHLTTVVHKYELSNRTM